jgi:hypothetical protein
MNCDLPEIYKSYRKFIDDSVFGEGEKEAVPPDEEEQRRFAERFDTDFAVAKARKQTRQSESAGTPAGGSGEHCNWCCSIFIIVYDEVVNTCRHRKGPEQLNA